MIKAPVAIVAFLFSVAAAPPPPPASINEYIAEGEYSGGDYGWMRGAFPKASENEKQEYQAVTTWLDLCSKAARSEELAKLRELGIETPRLENSSITYPLCGQVAAKPQISVYDDFEDFSRNLATTKPIFDALASTVWLAERVAGPTADTLTDELLHRPIADQIFRSAFRWAMLAEPVEGIPWLTEKQRPIFLALLVGELSKTDRSNTAWLEKVIDENGWPTFSMVGEDATQNAWLLAQHADHDPAFQLKVLRMMEPLRAEGEVSQQNYAYLYDRVMLKLRGTQKFGTQVTCEDGERVPLPLEDEEKLPEHRQEAGLEPFDDYLTRFSSPCPTA